MDKLKNSFLSFGFTLMFCQGMQILPKTGLFQNSGFFSPLKCLDITFLGGIAFSAYILHFELKGINRQLRCLNNSGLLLSLSSLLQARKNCRLELLFEFVWILHIYIIFFLLIPMLITIIFLLKYEHYTVWCVIPTFVE